MLFLVSEIWSLNLNHLADFFFVPKDAQCSETDFLVLDFFFRFLIFRDMVDAFGGGPSNSPSVCGEALASRMADEKIPV